MFIAMNRFKVMKGSESTSSSRSGPTAKVTSAR